MKVEKSTILRTYLIYSLVVILMAMVLLKTLLIIHDGRDNIFSSESDKIEQRVASITPRRGEILDAKASPLVTSVAFYDIYMDPTTVKEKVWNNEIHGLCKGLAKLFPEKSAKEYEALLREARAKKRRYVLIQKNVTNETRRKLRELPIFKLGRFKGGIIDNKATIIRKRPHDELFRRTLGYIKITEQDTIRLGLEGAYDHYLAGQPGKVLEQRISNSWKPTGTIIREAQEGFDIVTSIDKDIQEVAHTELENQLKTKGGRYGCAIVMDVKTGFIKAMVNLQKGDDENYYESFNHAIATKEVPGSTFKLASLMAALEDKKVHITDSVNAVGRYEFYNRYLNDSKKYGYGKITLKEAFEVSSNVISKVIFESYREEPQQFIDRLNSFGLTEKLNIPISGESSPAFTKPGDPEWWGGSLAWMSIGYEFQLTPLQMLSFYNAVANNGKYMQPQFVAQIKQGGNTIETISPVVLHEKICSQNTLDLLKTCLEGVMTNGTGKNLKSTFFTTAGKTGTAQIANRNLGYGKEGEKKHIASFAGYFPAEDPIYSCIVVIAAPTDDIYGASVSGTVFSAIANKVYATSLEYHKAINEKKQLATTPITHHGNRHDLNKVLNDFNVKRTFQHQTEADNGEWVKTEALDKSVHYKGQEITPKLVPNVVGMGLSDAIYLLEKSGMRVAVTGYGTVKSQSILPGQEAIPGGRIEITLKN
jgi:cell division protein FtsI (penicillin-binding protein 3)